MFSEVKLRALYDNNISFTIKLTAGAIEPKRRFKRGWSYVFGHYSILLV